MEQAKIVHEKQFEDFKKCTDHKIWIALRNNIYGIFIGSAGGSGKANSKTYKNNLAIIISCLRKFNIKQISVIWEHKYKSKYFPLLIKNNESEFYNFNDFNDIELVDTIIRNLQSIKHPETGRTSGNTSPIYIESIDLKNNLIDSILFEIIKSITQDSTNYKWTIESFFRRIKKLLHLGRYDFEKIAEKTGYWIACLIRIRRGQYEFRKDLLEIFDHKCFITGSKVEESLEAAHLIPYSKCNEDYMLETSRSNGIILRADIHTLFDLGLISLEINKEYKISIKFDKKLKVDDSYKDLYEKLKKEERKDLPHDSEKFSFNRNKFAENLITRNTEYNLSVKNEIKQSV